MDVGKRCYIAIDLKSFYASVECVERGLDPLDTNLVVADAGRTDKTICLAVSPPLKRLGTGGRPRMFEVRRCVADANRRRLADAHGHSFSGSSVSCAELSENSSLELDFIVAKPRMAHYIEFSTRIYDIYLRFVAPEDMHVYSIDEVFIDATSYLPAYSMSAHDFARLIIRTVLRETGVTATAGIGTNLYLCKVAMDIMAKHIQPDRNGVRIAELDEMSYRLFLWGHRPLTDFWRVGRGYAKRLEEYGLYTMGDVARCSLEREELLYQLFGVNAELLIDHAWGWEPTTIADIKAYKPQSNSIGSGQVLHCPYTYDKTKLVVWEMADQLSLDLVDKGMVTDQVVLTVGYDMENLRDPAKSKSYHGPVTTDHYGRAIPKHAHGTKNLKQYTSSTKLITQAVMELFARIVDPDLLTRRVYLVAAHVVPESSLAHEEVVEQLDLFTDQAAEDKRREVEAAELERERKQQEAVLGIKRKFGKNAILKGANLVDGATAKDRNGQIGGHRA